MPHTFAEVTTHPSLPDAQTELTDAYTRVAALLHDRHPALAAAAASRRPRWFTFVLVSADGSVGGRGRVVASSPEAAVRFASLSLAGASTVRLEDEVDGA